MIFLNSGKALEGCSMFPNIEAYVFGEFRKELEGVRRSGYCRIVKEFVSR
jgi:hypothetical protein